jgi:hypothetical protein
MRTLYQGLPAGSIEAGRYRRVPLPDCECLGSPHPGPGCEVGAGTNALIEMHGPSRTMDRTDGNDPVQPLCHGVPEFFRQSGEGIRSPSLIMIP